MPPRGPSSVHPFVCVKPGCPKPRWPRDLDYLSGRRRHGRRYHQEAVKVTYQNRTRILYRNPTTQKFDCPCGAPKHARREANRISSMCSKPEHPAPDDDSYAKEAGTDDESANVSNYKMHRRPRKRPASSPLPLTRKRRETTPAQSSDDEYHAPVSDPPGGDHRVSWSMAASNSSGQNTGPSGDSGGDSGNLAEVQRSSKRRNAARDKLIKSLENQRSILAQKAEEVDRTTAILMGI
ncbi:hypothetical protein EV121DRAFT_296922 [Schizophyllum commune]